MIQQVKRGKPVEQPFAYHWRSMPAGVKKWCPSPIDAVIEVLMLELRVSNQMAILTELGIDHASISRCRHRHQPIQHQWLLRATILSNIPYTMLCAVCEEEPQFWPHPNAWREK